MKESKKIFKLTSVLLIFGLSVFLLAGCGSSNSDNNTSGNKRGFNQTEMKQRYSDKLKELVSNGTITQAQSDKILNALTTGNQGNFNRKQNGGQSNSTQRRSQNSDNSNGQTNRRNFNPLSKLVEDGTITQQQADTVWNSLRGNRTGNWNGNKSGSTNNSSGTTQQ